MTRSSCGSRFRFCSRAAAGAIAEPCPTDANGLPIVPEPTCARYSVFSGGNYSTIYNAEASAYAEDRWLITNRLLIEPGVRFDWDEIVRTPLFSPRLAGTYIFDDESNTKLSAGIGITYDATSLGLIHQALEGQRVDYFFDSNGCPQEANGDECPVHRSATGDTGARADPTADRRLS